MNLLNKILNFFLGNKKEKELKFIKFYLDKVKEFKLIFNSFSPDELRNKTLEFKKKIFDSTKEIKNQINQLNNEIKNIDDITIYSNLYLKIDELNKICYEKEQKILEDLLPEAFALIISTAKLFTENHIIKVKTNNFDKNISQIKDYVYIDNNFSIWKNSWNVLGKKIIWNMEHYDVQIIGGIVLHFSKIAEMSTGEGKTLVATLPIYLNALTGRGVHLITVNDYLSRRDSAWMAPIFEFHGISVDCIDNYQPNSIGRKQAYCADITYGTNSEFGFDYLRDNMSISYKDVVQRELNFAIVDEVDSILIDDARTPLIISGPVKKNSRENDIKKEYQILKLKVEKLFLIQKKELLQLFNQAKILIKNGNKKEGGIKLYKVFKGMPKYKPLIKFLSEEGIKTLLQKIDSYYITDHNREISKITKDLYFIIDEKNNYIELTDKGIEFLSKDIKNKDLFILPDLSTELLKIEKLNLDKKEEYYRKEKIYNDFNIKSERIHSIHQLLKAYSLFEKNVEYVVINKEVKIVDEQTGRIMEGRRYSDGLHQALEAKENLKVESSTQTFANLTLQNYFRMYKKLSGMTGTAETESREFWEIYKLDVVVIPTNKPIQRIDKNDLVFRTNREKFNAVIEEIIKISTKEKRPVLVGTTSVEISELLSRSLSLRNINHNVLNAKRHEKEAEIISKAGNPSIITISTNMAGRGTDIKITQEVKKMGGLAVIGTERHDSRRVDRQLRGRSGRQGDPGCSQFYISLEDNLMRLFGSDRISKLMDRIGYKEGEVIQHSIITKSIERAQKKVEENNFGIRKKLLEYDDVMNKQREIIYKRRKNALFGHRLRLDIINIIYNVIELIVLKFKENNDDKQFQFELIKFFNTKCIISNEDLKLLSNQELIKKVNKYIINYYKKEKIIKTRSFYSIINNIEKTTDLNNVFFLVSNGNKELEIIMDIENINENEYLLFWNRFEQAICISIIDEYWKIHLREMDELRRSVQTVSYEQKDPLVVYKQESFDLFLQMINAINKEIISFLFKSNFHEINNIIINNNLLKEEKKDINNNVTLKNQNQIFSSSSYIKTIKKIGRNDIVEIKNLKTGENKLVKFKQVESFLLSGIWILNKE